MSWIATAIGGSAVLGYLGSQNAANTQANAANNATGLQQGIFNQTQQNLAPWLQSGNMALSQLNYGLFGNPGQSGGTPGTPGTPGTAGGSLSYDDWLAGPGAGYAADPEQAQVMYANYAKSTPGTPGTPGTGQQGFSPASGITPGMFSHQFNLQDFQASPAYNFNLEQGKLALDKASAARGKYYAPSTLQDIAKYSQGLASNEYQNAFSNYNTGIGNIYNRLQQVSGSGQNAAAQQGGFGAAFGNAAASNSIGAANAQAAGQVGGINALTGGVSNYLNYDLTQQILANNQKGSVPYNASVNGYIGPLGYNPQPE